LVHVLPDHPLIRRNALVSLEYDPDASPAVRRTMAQLWGEWAQARVGVNEGLLPFKLEETADVPADQLAQRLEEERRLMYVGITRARNSLVVSWLKRRKKGREFITGKPSRFIAEMALDQSTAREDPREKLRALRAEFAQRAQVATNAAKPT
jgi:ATP-dependent DNA helicase Rep